MTQEEIRNLRGLFVMYAAYYRQTLQDEVVVMYADDLADLPFAQVRAALDAYRKNPKNRFLPMPADIRALTDQEATPDAAAREIAARIVGAIPKFGYSNRSSAEAYIGPIGWRLVERQGGWQFICENLGTRIDSSSFQAQIRDQAKSELTHSRAGLDKAIGLVSSQSSNLLTNNPAASLINKIGKEMP